MRGSRLSCAVALLLFGPMISAHSQVRDSFGQIVAPEIENRIERLRTLRIPFGKTPEKAAADAAAAANALREIVAQKPDYFRGWFNLGLALNEAGDYKGAISAFDTAIGIRDRDGIKDVTVFNSAGWAALRNGDYPTAEKYLTRALADIGMASENTALAIHLNLGELYFNTQRLDLARRHYTIARDTGRSQKAVDALALIDQTAKAIEAQKAILK